MLVWPFRSKPRPATIAEAQSAKPVRLVEPDVQHADGGVVRLKVRLQSGRWNRWIFRLPEGATKTFELDQLGWFVWELCDGKSSVQQIIRKLASRYNLNLREAEVSTLAFLRMLIKKGLIGIPVRKNREDRK